MKKLIQTIRAKYHPLHRMRSSTLGRLILKSLDFPLWVKLDCLPHSFRISAFRNASYIENTDTIEPEIRSCFELLAELYPLKMFWDIGANVGFYSYYLHAKVEDLAVTAFEPDPGNLSNLMATQGKHSLNWLEIRSECISNNINESIFYVDTLASVTGSLVDADGVIDQKMHGVKESSTISVLTTTLDNEFEAASPDLVKIDVEGAELLVLEGGQKLFHEKGPIVIIEVKKENLMDVLKIMSRYYSSIFAIGNLDVSHPNLIALPNKPAHAKSFFIDKSIKLGLAIKPITA